MDDTQQEMTLEQWVNRLPAFHLAHKEYDQLQAKVKELEAYVAHIEAGRNADQLDHTLSYAEWIESREQPTEGN